MGDFGSTPGCGQPTAEGEGGQKDQPSFTALAPQGRQNCCVRVEGARKTVWPV